MAANDQKLGDQNSPQQVGLFTNWMSVSAGEGYTMALRFDSSLWAWGFNGSGLGLVDKSKIVIRWYYPLQQGFYYPFKKSNGEVYGAGDPVTFLTTAEGTASRLGLVNRSRILAETQAPTPSTGAGASTNREP